MLKWNTTALHPEHKADLRKSGLRDETIAKAKIHSVPPCEFKEILGSRLASKINSLLAFPYPNFEGFVRYKLFPPIMDSKEKRIRYFQQDGSEPHLYFPPAFDFKCSLVRITEGEKKALKATQEGLNCIGLGGIWNFQKPTAERAPRLIDDFNLIEWDGKDVEIVPDSGFISNVSVKQAVFRLGRMLEELKGARVRVVHLPLAV